MLYTSAAHTAHCLSRSSSVVPVKDEEQSISHTANISIVMLGIFQVLFKVLQKKPYKVFLYKCCMACSYGLYLITRTIFAQ